jgi:uncharacterized membrane protein
MSLRTVTEKFHGIIEAVALVLAVVVGAVYGFSHLMELAAVVCLVAVCIALHRWVTSRP